MLRNIAAYESGTNDVSILNEVLSLNAQEFIPPTLGGALGIPQ